MSDLGFCLQHTLADSTAGPPACKRAEGILTWLLQQEVVASLVQCTAEAPGKTSPSTILHVRA